MALCPCCDQEIEVDDAAIDDEVVCEGCSELLTVTSVDPLELEQYDGDEDDDDEDGDTDDDDTDDDEDDDEFDDDTEEDDED